MQSAIQTIKSTSHNAVLTSLLHSEEEMDDLEKNGRVLNDAEGKENEIERGRRREGSRKIDG